EFVEFVFYYLLFSASNSSKTPKVVIHHEFIDTPDGSVYWVPRVFASVLQVLGTVDDSLDECIEIYRKYASEAAERKLTYNEQLFIIKAANANIGVVRAYNLYTDLKGSSSLMHGTQTEFKNFTRGVNCFIRDSDAQMLITRMEHRQKFIKEFSFDYFVKDAELCGFFRYNMVFVPFTAIDKHRKSATVGSGLLKKETVKAYGWLLRAFKKAFVRSPNIFVTDQDGAMRLVVAAEFPKSKNRLCMWNIMQKIPAKIVSRICDDTDFKDKFGKIVWNMFIGPEEFNDRWNKLMEEFNLVNHEWLSKMYRLRSSWVPAFFVDSPLCGLMRTTSESENSFFSYFTCSEHAAKVYTRSLFIRVQKKIVAGSWLCSITGMSSDEGCTVCIIDEEKMKHVGLPEVIDKESTLENVEEKINLHQKVTGHYKEFYLFEVGLDVKLKIIIIFQRICDKSEFISELLK
nr:hypothetical protein [Tanacetum cinerariifolium]